MSLTPEIPEQMPSMGNSFTRALGRGVLRVMGWKVTGELPNRPKLIIAVAPHTSNWDFIVAVGALLAMGLKVSAMMKKEVFIWPFGPLCKKLGFMPIDRSDPKEVVTQMKEKFEAEDNAWLGITPEGTRSKVERWKTGFLRIAEEVNLPVLLVGVDSVAKEIVLDKTIEATGNHEEQAEELRQYMNNKFEGINPSKQ